MAEAEENYPIWSHCERVPAVAVAGEEGGSVIGIAIALEADGVIMIIAMMVAM